MPRARSAPIPAVDAPLALPAGNGPALSQRKQVRPAQGDCAAAEDANSGRVCPKPRTCSLPDSRGLAVASAHSSQKAANVFVQGPPPLADDETLDSNEEIATNVTSLPPDLDPMQGPKRCDIPPETDFCMDTVSQEAVEEDRPGVDESEYELRACGQLCEALFMDYHTPADPSIAEFIDTLLL